MLHFVNWGIVICTNASIYTKYTVTKLLYIPYLGFIVSYKIQQTEI